MNIDSLFTWDAGGPLEPGGRCLEPAKGRAMCPTHLWLYTLMRFRMIVHLCHDARASLTIYSRVLFMLVAACHWTHLCHVHKSLISLGSGGPTPLTCATRQ